MICKDVKDIVKDYGTVMDLVKEICTDRACTLDAIQKSLETKNIEMNEPTLLAVIEQIKEMMVFAKERTYDIGDVITYRHYYFGIIDRGEAIGNTIVKVEYKNFFLYNEKRCGDKAFREHIFSKLEFEELARFTLFNTDRIKEALEELKIEKDKWINYVVIDNEGLVFCKKWHSRGGYSTNECLGKLVRRTSSN